MVALSKMDRGLTTGARAMKPRRNPFPPSRPSAARGVQDGGVPEVDGTREAPALILRRHARGGQRPSPGIDRSDSEMQRNGYPSLGPIEWTHLKVGRLPSSLP